MWQKFNVSNSFSLQKDEIILQVLILINFWNLLFYIKWWLSEEQTAVE